MTLKDSCNELRSKTDYVLDPKLPIIVMVDGRSFSKLIKKKFKLPFDQEFIRIMNETAEYCASKIQGCKFAYTQSDEISFLIDQRDSPDAEPFFGGRLCKIQSIIASMASGKFMQLLMSLRIKDLQDPQEIKDFVETFKLPEFDCKAWNVPDSNKVYAWFLFRQQDCLRNSKQQSAQTYLPDRILKNKSSDEQIEILKTNKGIDWNDYSDSEKYGRFLWKETFDFTDPQGKPYTRSKWTIHEAYLLSLDRQKFYDQLGYEYQLQES